MSLHDIWRGDVMPQSGVAVSIGRNTFDPPAPVVPVYDIHARSLVFHDSGSNAGSGIVQYNSENRHLQLIPSNSGAQPIVTAVLFDAYDALGGSGIFSVATPMAFATTRLNTHSTIFSFDSLKSELTFNMPGTYEITYRISGDNTGAIRSSARSQLEERTVAGNAFAAVTGSLSFGYHRLAANGEGSMTAKVILEDLKEGHTVRVTTAIISGDVVGAVLQIVDSSSLTARKLA
jgi:hypothetical protein